MYLLIIILPLIGSIFSSFLGRKIGVSTPHVVTCVGFVLLTLAVILSSLEAYTNLFRFINLESFNIILGLFYDSVYLLHGLIICYLIEVLSKYKYTLECVQLYVFSYIEIYFVLYISNIHIRPVLNSFILGIGFSHITNLIVLILVNIILSRIIFNLLKLLRSYFYIFYKDLILLIEIRLVIPLLAYDQSHYGIVAITQKRLLKRQRKYIPKALHYLRLSRKYSQYSSRLNNIAPLMNRSGNGGLYDSFRESATRFKEQADIYEEKGLFFWLQGRYIAEHLNVIVVPGSWQVSREFPNIPLTLVGYRTPPVAPGTTLDIWA